LRAIESVANRDRHADNSNGSPDTIHELRFNVPLLLAKTEFFSIYLEQTTVNQLFFGPTQTFTWASPACCDRFTASIGWQTAFASLAVNKKYIN
jgi:hypothetical protein